MTQLHKNEVYQAVVEVLASIGAKVQQVEEGGRHVKVYWVTNGRRMRITVPRKSSRNFRQARNARTHMRQILREQGVVV
jgi:hypothetical protein